MFASNQISNSFKTQACLVLVAITLGLIGCSKKTSYMKGEEDVPLASLTSEERIEFLKMVRKQGILINATEKVDKGMDPEKNSNTFAKSMLISPLIADSTTVGLAQALAVGCRRQNHKVEGVEEVQIDSKAGSKCAIKSKNVTATTEKVSGASYVVSNSGTEKFVVRDPQLAANYDLKGYSFRKKGSGTVSFVSAGKGQLKVDAGAFKNRATGSVDSVTKGRIPTYLKVDTILGKENSLTATVRMGYLINKKWYQLKVTVSNSKPKKTYNYELNGKPVTPNEYQLSALP